MNQMVLAAMLEQLGCRVDIVDDGEAACDAAAHTHYDMVFMDCHMPVMDGFEAARRIRDDEARTDGTHTPIVALTALALAGDRERCLSSGMDDYMTKPVRAAQLAAAVHAGRPQAWPLTLRDLGGGFDFSLRDSRRVGRRHSPLVRSLDFSSWQATLRRCSASSWCRSWPSASAWIMNGVQQRHARRTGRSTSA